MLNFTKIRSIPINTSALIVGLAAYFALVLNAPFIIKTHTPDIPISTFITIPLFLLSLFISLFSLLCVRRLEKIVFIPLTLLSSILSFGYAYYGLSFDDYSPMIATIEQTRFSELSPYLTPSFFAWFLFFGILPAYLIYQLQWVRYSFWKDSAIKCLGLLIYPVFYFSILLPSLPIYHPMLRLSGLAARLPFQIVPMNFFENAFNYYHDRWVFSFPYKEIGLDATSQSETHHQVKKNLLVLVIGETARSMNYELNGYQRKTNPYLTRKNMVSFPNVSSCGTSTRVSVPCLFSSLSRQQFSLSKASHQDNALDILKRAGFNVIWIDNNGPGDCQGVCKHMESIFTSTVDGELVNQLATQIMRLPQKDSVIILHLKGSHGPDYYTKYPPAFRQFTPDCQKNELRLCNPQTLLNAYDNTIVYTDYVLNEMIRTLKKQRANWNTGLIYTSDHGESIGRQGLYGHCAPYLIAPKEQTQVPLIVWSSPELATSKGLSMTCLHDKAVSESFSHDNFFHSILGLMNVRTTQYQNPLDVFHSCRDPNKKPAQERVFY